MIETGAAPRAPRAARWTQRFLLIAVGLALVLMHHLVGAHQHPPAMHDPAVAGGVHSSTAVLHVHHEDGGHDMGGMLHDCLAVLAAAIALARVGGRVRGGPRVPAPPPPGAARGRRRTSRPPAPVPVLLAQLQVLRL